MFEYWYWPPEKLATQSQKQDLRTAKAILVWALICAAIWTLLLAMVL